LRFKLQLRVFRPSSFVHCLALRIVSRMDSCFRRNDRRGNEAFGRNGKKNLTLDRESPAEYIGLPLFMRGLLS